ncbi:MAG: polysaccharide biosynthesis/export family protein [Syntrophobacteraceae bacterium]|nr:polysaccharide biosynthesis/export family protein [Syntrophobacteraceae bacterium]
MNSFLGRKGRRLVAVLALLVPAAACQSARTVAPALAGQPYHAAKPGPAPGVRLRSGDVIEIKFAYAAQFDQTETVRPDGKIELPLAGEVVVEGKTPAQLREELMKRYSVQLKHPQLAVVVRGLYERRVYVGGEVKKPGSVLMPGEMTALEAVMDAGGFNRQTAEAGNVIVVRNIAGNMIGMSVDLKGALKGERTRPFFLEPRDIVYVPRTHIADIDLWVEQHLWKLLPPIGIGATIY